MQASDGAIKLAQDLAVGDDSSWHIDVYQSGGLVDFAKRLAALTSQAHDQQEEACYATATILMAAAALEALLAEFAYITDRTKYTNEFRKAGVSKKYQLLTSNELAVAHPPVAELWEHRIAIGHSEPDNARSRFYGTRVNRAGASWACSTLEDFARQLWGARMPDWLRKDGGL